MFLDVLTVVKNNQVAKLRESTVLITHVRTKTSRYITTWQMANASLVTHPTGLSVRQLQAMQS